MNLSRDADAAVFLTCRTRILHRERCILMLKLDHRAFLLAVSPTIILITVNCGSFTATLSIGWTLGYIESIN